MLGQDLQSIVAQMLRAVGDVKEAVSLHMVDRKTEASREGLHYTTLREQSM